MKGKILERIGRFLDEMIVKWTEIFYKMDDFFWRRFEGELMIKLMIEGVLVKYCKEFKWDSVRMPLTLYVSR